MSISMSNWNRTDNIHTNMHTTIIWQWPRILILCVQTLKSISTHKTSNIHIVCNECKAKITRGHQLCYFESIKCNRVTASSNTAVNAMGYRYMNLNMYAEETGTGAINTWRLIFEMKKSEKDRAPESMKVMQANWEWIFVWIERNRTKTNEQIDVLVWYGCKHISSFLMWIRHLCAMRVVDNAS